MIKCKFPVAKIDGEPIMGVAGIVEPATEEQEGIVKIATQEEVADGTNDRNAITPLKAKNVFGGKVQIDYYGNNVFKVGNKELNFKDIYDLLLVSKDFTFIVYGNRAYLCSFVNDESATKELRFESVINSDLHTKTSSIYITSDDGVNITNVTTSNINSENQSNKVDTIEGDRNSSTKYPSNKALDAESNAIKAELRPEIKAVRDSVAKQSQDVVRLKIQKANIDGYYTDMSVGLAENLISPDGVTDSEPYTFRTTAGNQNVTDGYANLRSIKGNTVVWNQLAVIQLNAYPGITSTSSDGYSCNIHGVLQESIGYDQAAYTKKIAFIRDGRKYLLHRNKTTPYPWGISGYVGVDGGSRTFIWSNSDGGVWNGAIFNKLTVGDAIDVDGLITCVVDLTRLFGAGNEPSALSDERILWLEEQLEKYPQHDEGTLLNVDASGIKSTGFNLWDEEWELGSIRTDDGSNVSTTTTIRSKNYIPVVANTEYCFRCSIPGLYILWYDAAKKYISYSRALSVAAVQKPLEGASYCRFRTSTDYGGIYLNDICINLSWSGYRDGEYEPYWSQTRALPPIKEILGPDGQPLFPDGLCRAGDVYDEITPTKAMKRVGYSEESGVYALAEPIEVQFAEPYNFTYKISDFGTEEYLSSARTAPVCHETLYMHNLRDDVRRLPSDYQSQTSMSNLLSALGQALGRSITAVWDEETRAYKYEITEEAQHGE